MVLYENFNTTNQTSPYFEGHANYVTDVNTPFCGRVHNVPYDRRCEYTRTHEECHENDFIFDYIEFLYCTIDISKLHYAILGDLLLFAVCCIVFIILGTTADCFFCPALTVISRMMGLSENVAGVTLLAFGNGSPDMFTSFAGINSNSRRLYSDIFAAATFVVFTVTGAVLAMLPFEAYPIFFMRDALFLLLDVLVIDYTLKKGTDVSAGEAACILLIYLCYIFVVLMDQYLVKRATRVLSYKSRVHGLSSLDAVILHNLRSQGVIEHRSRFSLGEHKSFVLSVIGSRMYATRMTIRERFGIWRQFFSTLNPYNPDEWDDASFFMRFFLIIRMPIIMGLTILMPIVDMELEDHGWSKLLNCLQIMILPTVLSFQICGAMSLFGIPVWGWIILMTMPLASFVCIITRSEVVPVQHKYFSILTLAGSSMVVYDCAQEIISILSTLGVTTMRSNSFIGCTLLAWGNSIGDLIANLALAHQGYQKMAVAACFGGPLFNSLVAVGVTIFYTALQKPDYKIHDMAEGIMGENCTVFMIVGLSCTLLATTTTHFVMRRSIGIFMLIFYSLFVVYAFLGEFEVIHTYGADHRMDQRIDPIYMYDQKG